MNYDYMNQVYRPTLQHLINRIKHDENALLEMPDNEILLKRIEKNKQYIIQCVMQHSGNPAFSKIVFRE